MRRACMGPQEVAELVKRNQAMEVALQDVLTSGERATAVAGWLQAKGHGEVVGAITSECRALCDNVSLLLLPNDCKEHTGDGWIEHSENLHSQVPLQV